MKRIGQASLMCLLVMLLFAVMVPGALAAGTQGTVTAVEAAADASTGSKAIGAAICVGLAAAGGAVAMGLAIAKAVEGISRQPEAEGKIRTSLMLGMVFIETVVIYALIVAILIVFVL